MTAGPSKKTREISRPAPAVEPLVHSAVESWLWRIVFGTVVATLLLVFPFGHDVFRAPKEAVFRTAGIALAAIFGYELLVGRARLSAIGWKEPASRIVAAVLIWSAIAALFSSNLRYSLESFVTIGCGAAFFAAAVLTARLRPLRILLALLIPAIINGLLVIVQELKIWNPFDFDPAIIKNPHLATTGLLGNPNDAGMLQSIAALAAIAAALAAKKGEKTPWAIAAVFLVISLFVSQTMTAILAFFAALAALLLLVSRKKAIISLGILALVAVVSLGAYAPLRTRVAALAKSARAGNIDVLLTRRLGAFLAAFEMVKDNPLTGVGPGTFGWHYFDYKLRVDQEYQGLIYRPSSTEDWTYNFAEVHNDHLEIASEAGLPAYVIFVTALGVLASGSFHRRDVTLTFTGRRRVKREFARVASLPLAVLIFFLGLGQFPLQLAATTVAILFVAAISYSWSRDDLA